MKKLGIIRNFVRTLFSDELWELNMESLHGAKKRLVDFIKIIRCTLTEFAKNRMGFQCVALSYFGALATIPLVAFIFAVTGGLGVKDKIETLILTLVPADPAFLNVVAEKAGNIVDSAKSGGVGTISAILFFWTVIWLLFQIERVFNNVWNIRKNPRKVYLRFSFYIGAMLLTPFLVILFGAGIAFYSNITGLLGLSGNVKEISALITFLGHVAHFAVAALTFSVMYKFIPATYVRYRNALLAGMVAAFCFTIFQYLYLQTQVFMSRLNGVYGAIAAIPLFLMWMNYSWQIIIYGEQLCYGIQNRHSYKIPEGRLKDYTPLRDEWKKELEEAKKEDRK